MDPRTVVAGIAVGRVAIGAAVAAVPQKTLGPRWVGEDDARRPTSQLLLRSVGARDVALGLGTLAALARGDAVRPWVLGGALADGVDFVATLAAHDHVPRTGLIGAGVLAGGTAVVELALAGALP